MFINDIWKEIKLDVLWLLKELRSIKSLCLIAIFAVFFKMVYLKEDLAVIGIIMSIILPVVFYIRKTDRAEDKKNIVL